MQIATDLSEQITGSHVKAILSDDDAMLAVSADPLTHEMRRDLEPDLRRYRQRYLKKHFVEQLKLMEVKEVLTNQLLK